MVAKEVVDGGIDGVVGDRIGDVVCGGVNDVIGGGSDERVSGTIVVFIASSMVT